jgi:hypothetical protein
MMRVIRNKLRGLVFFILLLIPGLLGALAGQEAQDLTLANRYYDADDYSRAYVYFENLMLRRQEAGDGPSGDTLYRYAYSHEQIRGLDARALTLYALSRHRNEQEGRRDSVYAAYAANKLKTNGSPLLNLDDGEAAALMAELRESVNRERKIRFYRYADRFYQFFSRFSPFQWKLIASAAAAVPFLFGVILLKIKEKKSHAQ